MVRSTCSTSDRTRSSRRATYREPAPSPSARSMRPSPTYRMTGTWWPTAVAPTASLPATRCACCTARGYVRVASGTASTNGGWQACPWRVARPDRRRWALQTEDDPVARSARAAGHHAVAVAALGCGEHDVAVVDVAVQDRDLAGAAQPLLAVGGDRETGLAKGVQHRAIARHRHLPVGVGEQHRELVLLLGVQRAELGGEVLEGQRALRPVLAPLGGLVERPLRSGGGRVRPAGAGVGVVLGHEGGQVGAVALPAAVHVEALTVLGAQLLEEGHRRRLPAEVVQLVGDILAGGPGGQGPEGRIG